MSLTNPIGIQNVAAFATVELHNAESSHTAGYKLTLRLPKEEDWEQFKTITKRKKGKAGGIYTMYLTGTGIPRQLDVVFLAWTISNSAGAKIKFELQDADDFEFFRALAEGYAWMMTLIELDEENKPIDQQAREKAETVKGGPKSQRAGAMCADPSFQQFVMGILRVERRDGRVAIRATPDECAEFIRRKCKIASRAELDHDEAAWERFTRWVSKPFAIWSQR